MTEKIVQKGYQLVWEDNFGRKESGCGAAALQETCKSAGRAETFKAEGLENERKSVNAQDWSLEVGERWANNEQQAYTDSLDNVSVYGGQLHITAKKQTCGIRSYTSGRITTAGKHSWQYGYFEIRAKLPKGHGSWPAIWMMPDSCKHGNPWPHCGEIDIMEHIGRRENSIWFSLHSERHNHTRKDTKQYTTIREYQDVCSEFHTYGMEWTDGAIEFFVDGESACIYRKTDDAQDQTEAAWPYDQPFYLILNIAVGGGLGGEIHEEDLPYEMVVDYVRVYQKI